MIIDTTKLTRLSERMLAAYIQDKFEYQDIGIPEVSIIRTCQVDGSKDLIVSVCYQKMKITVKTDYYGITEEKIDRIRELLREKYYKLMAFYLEIDGERVR